ncbi:scaffolding protein [Microbacterium phage McGalleon]|uniref:Scaffolding protein n=1 Tax=Microbacterium phage McGalleon TaxID=2590936 RepID=A0A516KQT5_9CAUD|nr:scaffolding protein [Microbacterium phage McGalleon]QDP44058.1 scaffolding protein [Microbacterium phage McGalleon]
MPTEQDNSNGSTDETSGQEQQSQQQQATPETGGNGEQQQAAPQVDDSTQLPETHPLVKTLAANKEKLSKQATELAEARTQAGKVTQLEAALNERPTKEAFEGLQTRYDRLEAFLLAAGGPISKALDSRTFTKDLFESDKDVASLVSEWHKNNPSATAAALGGGGTEGAGKPKHDPNDLIRAAFKGRSTT